MSDLFSSALKYLSGPSQGPAHGPQGQGHNGGYSSASGGPSDETNAVGEVINFNYSNQKKSVRINKLIAEGGFSYVFRGVDVQSGDPVAVKKILAPDAEAEKGVQQEIEFMRQFHHEHIVHFFGSFVKGSGPSQNQKHLQEHYLFMEYCPVQLPTPPLRIQHTTQVFAQSCKAIKYLHEFGIVHRDIKLENLLIGSDGLIKLVDFGSATMEKIYPTPEWSMAKRTIVEEQIASKTTPMYRAPEMLDLWSNYPIDEHVDMWALGCLLFALNFGQHPFQDSNKLAIVNANYSLPKNVSDSGPVVSLIRGLLKVDPGERLTFGQILDVLQSIAESGGFSLEGQLPFKAASSPNVTGGSIGGIVNPMAMVGPNQSAGPQNHSQYSQPQSQVGAGGASLFSSLRGGAVSLIKNIKEQSQQYLAGPIPNSTSNSNIPTSVPSSGQGSQGQGHVGSHPPPSRPAPPSVSLPPTQRDSSARPPPPRPLPPSPISQRREGGGSHIEFENREYEAMQQHHNQLPPRPAPPKPPPPTVQNQSQHAPKIANLLDMSFDTGITGNTTQPDNSSSQIPSSNADLLGDLFGSQNVPNNEDLFWGGNQAEDKKSQPQPQPPPEFGDLLGDPLASVLGKSVPTSMPSRTQGMGGFAANFGNSNSSHPNPQPFLQPSMPTMSIPPNPAMPIPQSASFQNLNAHGNSFSSNSSLLDTGLGSTKIPKNSSSPNLLSDLILDDIMSIGGSSGNSVTSGIGKMNLGAGAGPTGSSFNKSNPSLNILGGATTINSNNSGNAAGNAQPNYNRTLFDPPPQQGKQNLNDIFGDILNSQGFATNKMDGGRTINDMRKIEMLSNPNANPTQIKVNEWREGKKKNIRALLSSLHTITWDECHWEETNMSQMITPAQVKKTYRKACLAIHPDKQMGKEWEELAKMIFVELNEAWAAFEETL